MKIIYFAWLRSKVGLAEETISPPAQIQTVEHLLNWLEQKGPNYQEALKNRTVVKVAVNQKYVGFSHPIQLNDEIALFPPISGG